MGKKNTSSNMRAARLAADAAPRIRQRWLLSDALILTGCIGWFVAAFATLSRLPDALPDFRELETADRKEAFFDYLSPMVEELNAEARENRAFVQSMTAVTAAGSEPSWLELQRIDALAQLYEVDRDGARLDEVLATLDRRIGVVPRSIVLTQAAIESGWGTSRFAIEGNNLFGQRCYENGCGIAPRGRPQGAAFGVARYESVQDSVESYVLNLNTHPEYRAFRDLREILRAGDTAIRGLDLAQGLLGYSERGQRYVDEVRSMIRQNGLE